MSFLLCSDWFCNTSGDWYFAARPSLSISSWKPPRPRKATGTHNCGNSKGLFGHGSPGQSRTSNHWRQTNSSHAIGWICLASLATSLRLSGAALIERTQSLLPFLDFFFFKSHVLDTWLPIPEFLTDKLRRGSYVVSRSVHLRHGRFSLSR